MTDTVDVDWVLADGTFTTDTYTARHIRIQRTNAGRTILHLTDGRDHHGPVKSVGYWWTLRTVIRPTIDTGAHPDEDRS